MKSQEYNNNLSTLDLFSLIYLLIPLCLFAYGWLQWWCSIPLIFLLLFSFFYKKNISSDDLFKSFFITHYKSTLPTFTIFICYIFLTGMTGNWQQHTDYYVRNDIFHDLVFKSWPPSLEDNRYFIYYFQTWLPAALIGKLTNWNIAQWAYFIWSIIGIFLSINYLYKLIGNKSFFIGIALITWNGLELIPCSLAAPMLRGIPFSEAFAQNDHASGSFIAEATCFSLKNCVHCFIPLSIICAMLFQEQTRKQYSHILGVLTVMYSPMASIILFPILAYLYLRDIYNTSDQPSALTLAFNTLKNQFSLQAICAFAVFFILILPYYSSTESISTINTDSIFNFRKTLMFFLFITLNCLIATYLIRRYYKDNFLWVVVITHFVCTLIGGYYHQDIAMKGSVITHYFLVLLFCKSFFDSKNNNRFIYYLYLICASTYFIHMTGAAASLAAGVLMWIILNIKFKYSVILSSFLAFAGIILIILQPPFSQSIQDKLSGKNTRYHQNIGIYQPDGGSGLWWWYRTFPNANDMPVWFKK